MKVLNTKARVISAGSVRFIPATPVECDIKKLAKMYPASSWLTKFQQIVSHAVLVSMNAQWAQFLRVRFILLTQMYAPSVEPVLMYAQAALSASNKARKC